MEDKKDWCVIIISGLEVKISLIDREKVLQHSWRITRGSTGRPRVITAVSTPKGSRNITLGKFLLNPPPGQQVYCRRFNEGLDYRRENLISCTLSERQRLLPKRKAQTSSQYRGVSFQSSSRRWRAAIEFEGKTHNLGEFKTEEAAAEAYNAAAKKFFGSIAYQNNITQKKKDRKD